MNIPFFKYQGAGNDFVIIDQRDEQFLSHSDTERIARICDRRFGIGADGLMLIERNERVDFTMVYFNSDGRQSTMCGNGGRCITSLASRLGIFSGDKCTFEAIDGLHRAILVGEDKVSLEMMDVVEFDKDTQGFILNTGSPHFVQFVSDLDSVDVVSKGRSIRESESFLPNGINVNFVEIAGSVLKIRTYERGVEDETLACGTGVTAAAIAWDMVSDGPLRCPVAIMAQGGELTVDFEKSDSGYRNIWLTGPATFVYKGVYKH